MISLDKIKAKANNEKVGINLVFKEHIHLLILDYLFRNDLFSNMVFQGGTALRFVYKGVRYSEDLDFVLKRQNSLFYKEIAKKLDSLPSYIDKFIPFAKDIQLKLQKDSIAIKRFVLLVEADIFKAKDKTNIEIAAVPSYENQVIIINREEILANPAVVVETPQEILSDKIVAFGARKYVKGRDIWDIFFLLKTLGVSLNKHIEEMCRKKISDYDLKLDAFTANFRKNSSLLKERGHLILEEEMDRFLPDSYRDLYKREYRGICEEVLKTLEAVKWAAKK